MKVNRWRYFVNTWFTFTRSEKHAALLISGILIIAQGLLWYSHFAEEPRQHPLTALEKEAEVKLDSLPEREKGRFDFKHKGTSPVKSSSWHPRPFDPNITTHDEFVLMGLSEKQAASLIRYRESMGGFRTKEDLARARVLPVALFNQWEPWIDFRNNKVDKNSEVKFVSYPRQEKVAALIDLNKADTLALEELPFIGAGRARAIVSYRNRLGGYYDLEQLREIRAIPDSVYIIIRPRLKIETEPELRKIDVNNAGTDSLIHPYISKPLARMIVNYREQHGNYKSLNDLEKLPLADAQFLRKIAPYLTFNP